MTGRSRGAGLPGSARPERRLPVTPGDFASPGRRGPPTWRDLAGRLPRGRSTFPFAAPSWPGTVERPPVRSHLGAAYDTAWARRYPARLARVLVTELVTRPVTAALARPEVVGTDRLAHLHEPVIFAANHSSHIDTPLLLGLLPEPWRHKTVVAGAADYFFDRRWRAAVSALAINAIPMERQRVSRDSANRAAALLREGWSLLIFPEGGRSPDGWGQHHRAGAAWLAVRTGRPIVPVHLAGTGDILPPHGARLRPGRSTVSFGHPIRPGADTDARRLSARVESVIAELADEGTTDWWTARRRAAAGETPAITGPDAAAWRRTWALGRPAERSETAGWPPA